ncbi:universal stress protein [Streptomyces sp. NPDC005840]|uniref:Universal stress protein n=1 Tax=Streptomyces doudnae TaxID=3075536 RepID=A0ABD5EXJ7_9ACTN|nr:MULTISPECIES: universal stress protein [unclassified Streptomyces]MDT0438897.1 universal stress protein [Streptomyces sp. DSM 41981]MYQ62770.1 universal stress protein [Streptomyces sp. SID4950]SCD44037.1 Nucleotide-binding universal stress protein, UspA family [Streptomyces sp. SolWspMP-5a-2]
MGRVRGDGTGRVVVGVSGSLGGLTALNRAAEEARRRRAELWAVLAWEAPGGDGPTSRAAVPEPLLREWRALAEGRLLAVLAEAFPTADGPGVPLSAVTSRGSAGRALVELACGEGDLLVVGTGRRGRLRRMCAPSVARYCLAHATCPVLAVPPSPLAAEVSALRGPGGGRRLRAEMRRLGDGR